MYSALSLTCLVTKGFGSLESSVFIIINNSGIGLLYFRSGQSGIFCCVMLDAFVVLIIE